MRGRIFSLSIAVTFLLLLTFTFRKHISDLADVARTWGSFHAHLQRAPSVVFRYPTDEPDANRAAVGLPSPVPPIIHQIFLTHDRPNASLAKYLPAIDSCRAQHPSWSYRLWSDANATAFIAAHYPDILPHYSRYPQNIQRANILRYALLHHFGGVYLDLDITCRSPLDAPLLSSSAAGSGPGHVPSLAHLPWLTPAAHPAGVNNAFILARAGHPLLTHLLAAVPRRDLRWGLPYVENMLSTGCMFFSEMWEAYARRLEGEWRGQEREREQEEEEGGEAEGDDGAGENRGVRPEDRIYVLADHEGHVEPHMLRGKVTTPLFAHGGASSWHGWDAAMIVTIGKYYRTLAMVGVGAGVAVAVTFVWRRRKAVGQRRRGRRSMRAFFGLERKSVESRHLMSEEI